MHVQTLGSAEGINMSKTHHYMPQPGPNRRLKYSVTLTEAMQRAILAPENRQILPDRTVRA